jgi:hypothetical protein
VSAPVEELQSERRLSVTKLHRQRWLGEVQQGCSSPEASARATATTARICRTVKAIENPYD